MGSINPELSLPFRPNYFPKSITEFLGEMSTIEDVPERISKLDDFIKRLEEEMRKIDAFKRELPLCMLLLNDAIVTLKEESMRYRTRNVEPVLEEFIPIKKTCDEDEKCEFREDIDKMNWMSSVQLWNSDHHTDIDFCDKKGTPVAQINQRAEEDNLRVSDDPFEDSKNRNEGRAFMSFNGYSVFPRKEDKEEFPVSGLSLLTPGIENQREELGFIGLRSKTSGSKANSSFVPSGQSNLRPLLQQQSSRKQRRCWSPELHRRFVNALQQLGGPQVATPKQIRELMQVNGLTNDEVKSHLQKYRLHSKRLPGTSNQPVVNLGGLWTPRDQCGDSSKSSNSNSGSPQGPLQLNLGGTSTTGGGDSSEEEEEEEEDDKSGSYSWKTHVYKSCKV